MVDVQSLRAELALLAARFVLPGLGPDALAAGSLAVGEFLPYFLGRLPAWDKQDDLDRRLMALLDEWERQATREGRSAAAEALRAVVREAVSQAG